MKIRTKVNLSIVLIIAMTVICVSVVYLMNYRVSFVHNAAGMVKNMEIDVVNLIVMEETYLETKEVSILNSWGTKYDTFIVALKKLGDPELIEEAEMTRTDFLEHFEGTKMPGKALLGSKALIRKLLDLQHKLHDIGHEAYIQASIVTVALVVIFFGVILGIIFSCAESVLKPLAKLVGGIKRFEQGDLSGQIEINDNNEMGDLAKDLNEMAARLKRSIYETNEKVEELERFNEAAIDREFRIKELRNKVKALEKMLEEKNGR